MSEYEQKVSDLEYKVKKLEEDKAELEYKVKKLKGDNLDYATQNAVYKVTDEWITTENAWLTKENERHTETIKNLAQQVVSKSHRVGPTYTDRITNAFGEPTPSSDTPPAPPKRRGRPQGSKNSGDKKQKGMPTGSVDAAKTLQLMSSM